MTRSDLELLRLARLARDYDPATLDAVRLTSRAWLEDRQPELVAADTAFLVEALFKCGQLTEAARVARKRMAQGEPSTAFDDFAQQYQRLAAYDFALPRRADAIPMFPPGAPEPKPRVLSVYHSSITFQTSGYTVRTQALLAHSALQVAAVTRIGYPWAAKLAKPTLAKVGKDVFSSTSGNVTYRHRRGHVTNQSLTFSNIGLSKHELIKAIGEVKPHLVHAASNFVNALPALLAARTTGLPFVYEMRGLWELTAGVGISGWLESERYSLERRIETFVAANADAVIVLSEVQRRELIERGVDERRVKVIANGHEPERLTAGSPAVLAQHCPGLSEWIAGRTVIGYAGAIAVYEGLQDLVEAFGRHRERFAGVAVVIAGDGPYFHQLAAQIAALRLEGSFRLLGRVPAEVADALYGIVDLCVLPRRPDLVSQLITPLKTVEILAHGKVLLASNVGAIAEQVERYGFGETFVTGDTADLARQLERVLSDLPRLKRRYAEASSRIAERFSWSVIAREWDELLTGVASTPTTTHVPSAALTAIAPLYDDRPVRVLEPLPLWQRVARASLLVDSERATYLRVGKPLVDKLRLLAMPESGEIAEAVVLGKPLPGDGFALRELLSLAPGRYSVFLYVAHDSARGFDARSVGLVERGPSDEQELESLAPFKRESREFLACELEHDPKSPTEIEIFSEHVGPARVAASYVPLAGAELNDNFTQRTKSKVTGTRFHYVTVEPGTSQLALFPRLSGRLMVELTPWGDGEILENRLRRISRVRSVPRDASLFIELDRSRTNILVAADINETLLDGSTIWLKTLVNTLAGLPSVNVYVVTNAIHVSNGVTAEVFGKPNVAKIDLVSAASDRSADLASQIRLLDGNSGGFDLMIVRGVDLGKALVGPATRARMVYYAAGMFRREVDGALHVDDTALSVGAKCSAVIFQNEQMEALFRERCPDYAGECYCIAPAVEEAALARAAAQRVASEAEELVVYAGKLVRDYGVLELAEAVRQLLSRGKRTRLVVLGSKFDGRDPDYQRRLESAFSELGDALTWLPAVSPSTALSWVLRADAVWGWRHGEFERSHFEISTKMVEAISCGAPIVLYPAPANVALMGRDYAGFGELATDAAAALERLLVNRRSGFASLSAELSPRFRATTAYRSLLERIDKLGRRRSERPERAGSAPASVLVAGHDFRFFENVEGRLLKDGHSVYREYWKSHTIRHLYGQPSLAERADIVFCEWCLGNAVWWSRNLPPGKRLFIRLHLQELSTEHPANVDFSRVEKVIFVSPHVMRQAIAKFGIPASKCVVIPISVNLASGPPLTAVETHQRRLVLGMVGMTPWRKRPDRALELLVALRERHPEVTLHLKGHTPSDYKWMSGRPEELAQYQGLFREIAPLERAGVVRLSGYDDKLEDFYRSVGWVLSVSDFEGCHTAVAEGGAMGCLPLMTSWAGADEVYSPELVQPDIAGLLSYFDEHFERFDEHSQVLQDGFQRRFGLSQVYEAWQALFFDGSRRQAALSSALSFA